jgi:hypothetical protein
LLKVLLLLTLLSLTVPAQTNSATLTKQATPLSTAFSSQRKLVRDSKGNLFAVYLKQAGNHSQVHLSSSADNGATWNEVGRVSDGDFESVRVTIAIDAADRLHIFWTKFIGEYGQIFYKVYDHGAWSSESQLTSGDAYSGYPSAAFDSKGLIHLVWYGFDGIAYQVFYSRFDGSKWSAPIKLSQGFPDSVNPTIAVDSRDNLHVAWYKSNGRQYQIYYIRWSGSWNEQVVLSSGLTDSFNPTLAIDRKDNVYVAWDKGEGPQTQIYYAVYSAGAWSQQTPLTSGDEAAENPSAAIDALGTLYVFYDKTDGQIYLREHVNTWSPEERLTAAGENLYPSVRWSFHNNPLSDAGGRIDYVWTSKDEGQTSVKYSQLTIQQPTTPANERYPMMLGLSLVGIIIGATLFFLILYRRRKTAHTSH